MPKYEFTYPSVGASEEKMLDDVLGILHRNRVSKELQSSFLLAVSEAFTNALVHGNKRNPRKFVKLVIDINNKALAADITDEGRNGLDRIRRRRPPDVYSEGGRGVDLIEYYASEVGFTKTEKGGLKVTVRFNLVKTKKTRSYI
jgi:anti-sigma regulatory factor (Ser/Thr protein kinase)